MVKCGLGVLGVGKREDAVELAVIHGAADDQVKMFHDGIPDVQAKGVVVGNIIQTAVSEKPGVVIGDDDGCFIWGVN